MLIAPMLPNEIKIKTMYCNVCLFLIWEHSVWIVSGCNVLSRELKTKTDVSFITAKRYCTILVFYEVSLMHFWIMLITVALPNY